MTTNRPFVAAIALCALVLGSTSGSAAPLTAADMYLDPAAVPSFEYDYDYFSPGYTASYANALSLKVMSAFQADGTTPYAQATVDYTGDITASSGSITFINPARISFRPRTPTTANSSSTTTSSRRSVTNFQCHPALLRLTSGGRSPLLRPTPSLPAQT